MERVELKEKKKEINSDQRRAVECRKNAVVSAGAGSGKTFVLAERFVELVHSGEARVDQILTLTFTRKAAAEMYERIYRRMLDGREESENIAREIVNFDKAQISTLDSFCGQIVRGAGGMFGIPPDFSTDEGSARETAEEASLGFILNRAGNPFLDEFIRLNGFERVWKDLFTSIAHDYLSLAGRRDFSEMARMQHEELTKLLEKDLLELEELSVKIGGLDAGAGKSIVTAREAVSRVGELRDAYRRGDFEELLRIIGEISWRKPGSNSKKLDMVLLIEFTDVFTAVRKRIESLAGPLAKWEMYTGFFGLMNEFQEEFLREKRRSRNLSFGDVQAIALEILRENVEIRGFYKNQYRFIMIDEFQDNNQMQKDLLFLLAEREDSFLPNPGPEDLDQGKLFFVGDEKQSIYRFRGADVSVFKTLCGELEAAGGKHLKLPRNYRSAPGLIRFFNGLFEKVLRNEGEDYEADFTALRPRSEKESTESRIKLFYKPFNSEQGEEFVSGDEAEAYKIARFIRGAVEKKELSVLSEGKERPADYDDFALLMRSTSNQYIYEKAFRRTGIPYTTESVRTLFLEAPVNDIYTLLQLIVFPGDRAAYAGYLRSPLVNLSDTVIFELLLASAGPFSAEPEEVTSVPEEREKYRRGKELYLFLKDRADEVPLAELINDIWFRYGYRYFILKNPSFRPYLEFYDYLYRLALQADSRGDSLGNFVDFLRDNLGKYERLEDLQILRESTRGVQILTIHKSKGLEFPVVILANTGNLGRNAEAARPYYISSTYGLTFFTRQEKRGERNNYFYEAGKEEEEKKDLAELKRLLYVGCTRAMQHLVVSGCHTSRNQTKENSLLNMTLRGLGWEPGTDPLADESLAPYMEEIENVTKEEAERTIGKVSPADPLVMADAYERAEERTISVTRREFAVTDFMPEDEPRKAGLPVTMESKRLPRLPSGREFAGEEKQNGFGTLSHYVMERKLLGSYSRKIVPPAYLAVFSPEERDVALADAEELCDRFFRHPLGSRASEASLLEPECDFFYRYEREDDEDLYISGRMDLFFESGDEAFIIDYKTDRYSIPGRYDYQMELYYAAARELTDKKIRCFFFYLRNSEAVEYVPSGRFTPKIPREAR